VVLFQAKFLMTPVAGARSVHGTDDVKLSLVTLRSHSCCGVEISATCAKVSKENLLEKCIKMSIYINSREHEEHGSLLNQHQST